jgi:hypothetical protein
MKSSYLLFALLVGFTFDSHAEKSVKLVGVVAGLSNDVALVEIQTSPGKNPVQLQLTAGKPENGVALVAMDAAKGKVSLNVDGAARELMFDEDMQHPTTDTQVEESLPLIHFRSLSLVSVISLYSNLKDRTILIHPQLGTPTFSLYQNFRTKEEAAEAIEKIFKDQNIATIRDGEHFIMVVPYSYTNVVTPKSDTLANSGPLIPVMSVNFRDFPLGGAVQTYADLMGKDIKDRPSAMDLSCCSTLTFYQETPLSRAEIAYALETQLAWHKLRFVPYEEGLKLESIR